MAIINQLSAANTYQNWLNTTENLISYNNDFTEGANGTFHANTSLTLDGNLAVTGNMNLDVSGFDNLTTNGNLVLEETDTGHFFSSSNTSGGAAKVVDCRRWSQFMALMALQVTLI